MRHRHFSLVELLVILATLTVIAGMSLPVFKLAKDQSMEIVCANNMRLIRCATMSYYKDWNSLPPVGFNPTHTTIEEERNDVAATMIILHGVFGTSNGYLPQIQANTQKDQVYFCPAANPHQESSNGSDYGVNCALFRRMNHGKLDLYPNAIMFADGYGDYHLMKDYDWMGFRWRHGKDAQITQGVVGRYGNGNIQAIMVDGSVKKFNFSEREDVYRNHIKCVPDDRVVY